MDVILELPDYLPNHRRSVLQSLQQSARTTGAVLADTDWSEEVQIMQVALESLGSSVRTRIDHLREEDGPLQTSVINALRASRNSLRHGVDRIRDIRAEDIREEVRRFISDPILSTERVVLSTEMVALHLFLPLLSIAGNTPEAFVVNQILNARAIINNPCIRRNSRGVEIVRTFSLKDRCIAFTREIVESQNPLIEDVQNSNDSLRNLETINIAFQ